MNATLLREGCGAFLLLAALFQSWSLMHRAGWPVSVLVILAAFAIPVLNHLGRLTGAAPPPSVTIRLLPALPMALLILFTAIRELTGDDLAGAGMALAAAGTLLFLQAAFAGSPARADRWLRVGIGLLGATALWSVYVVVRAVLDYGQVADRSVIAGLVMIAVYGIGLPGWFMIRTAKRASADWAAGCLLGAAVILVLMTSGATPVTLFFVALTMGLIALSDDSLLPRMQPPLTGADRWLLPALGVITVGSLTFSYLALGRLVGLLVGDARSAGSAVILIVCAGMAIFGFACRSHAGRGSSQTRLLMLGWAAAVVVLFLVNLALTSRVRVGGPLPMNFWALVGPLLIGAAVTLPASVRRLGPLQG